MKTKEEAKYYSVLVVTEKPFHECEMAQRLSEYCNVVLVKDGVDAVADLKAGIISFSAYVVDGAGIEKAVINNIAAIRQLEVAKHVPLILIVNDLSDELMELGFNAGATDIIVRPYSVYSHRRVLNYIRLNETTRSYRRILADLQAAQDELDGLLARTPGGLFRYRAAKAPGQDFIDYVSPGLIQMLGCDDEDDFRALVGNTFSGLIHPEDRERVLAEIRRQAVATGSDKISYRVIRKDGSVCWLEDWGNLVSDSNGEEWFYVVVLDITEKILANENFKRLAERDVLTDAYNRDVAFRWVEERRRADPRPCSLILVDVDDFKSLNDKYGHPFGDEVLKHLVRFLDNELRDSDIITRMGGDEFAAFVVGLGESDRLHYLVDHINKCAFMDFDSESLVGEKVTPTISLGVASAEDLAISLDQLYNQSDEALYRAKANGKDCFAFFSEG